MVNAKNVLHHVQAASWGLATDLQFLENLARELNGAPAALHLWFHLSGRRPDAALTKRLQIMDSTAFSLCMDNKIPIVVFNMYKPGILRDAVLGRNVGTLVCDEAPAK